MRLAALSLFVLLCAACNASSQSVWDNPPADTVTGPVIHSAIELIPPIRYRSLPFPAHGVGLTRTAHDHKTGPGTDQC